MSAAALELTAGITTPLANLDENELAFMREQEGVFRDLYPAMSGWLVRLVDAECQRRDDGQCRFPDPPALWSMSGADLAECLRACLVLVQSVVTERLRDLADGVLMLVGAFVNKRLIETGSFANN